MSHILHLFFSNMMLHTVLIFSGVPTLANKRKQTYETVRSDPKCVIIMYKKMQT